MMNKTSIAVVLALGFASAAQAQNCPCNGGAGSLVTSTSSPTLAEVFSNKMVCGNVGSERWQGWHNGSTSGPIVDYKLGPGVQPDPSSPVGTYVLAATTVSYNYGAGGTYTYAVCRSPASYTFCGAQFGGRDITNIKIGGAGLQSCNAVTNARYEPDPTVKQGKPVAKTAAVTPPPSASRVPVLKP